MSHDTPNWVQEMNRCNLHTLFTELIGRVSMDASEMSNLDQKWDYRLEDQAEGRQFRVARCSKGTDVPLEREPCVVLMLGSDAIAIETFNLPSQTGHSESHARVRWNHYRTRAFLVIDDSPQQYEIWQVSQHALAPVFFHGKPHRQHFGE